MKKTLAILIAGLIFVAIPMIASAHDSDRRNNGPQQTKGWVKERHDVKPYRYERHDKWERQAKKHYKQHQRQQHRQEHRYLARHQRPYYPQPAVVVGVPRIVFHFDW